MPDSTGGPADLAPDHQDVTWYALAPGEVAARLDVDPARGLTAAQAKQR
ncbi:MAG: hypothetical protein HGA44_13785, partial [Cellulomonadaceae bacterium]|nr:hypothetical protein [Cellulomonadaceae bacterium]